nr:YfhO family protein [Eubacterium sp.]
VEVYENKYFLPIAYAVNENINDWIPEEGNPFELQNSYFTLATGYGDVFKAVDYLNTEFDGLSGDDVTNNGTFWFKKNDTDSGYGYVDFIITPSKSGNTYIYVKSPDINSIEIDGAGISSHTQSISEPYIFDLGHCEEGEEIKISLDCSNIDSTDTYAEIYAYTVDEDILKLGYKRLYDSSLSVTKHSDTKISGTINVKENSVLYSSIPYDSGWSIYIDGEKAETFEIGNALLCTSIKPGEHTVEYVYKPRGLSVGIIISAASIAGICGYIVFEKVKRKKKSAV